MTKFTLHGEPATAEGTTWTYDSVDDGVRYVLEGVLHAPVDAELTGERRYPGVIVHHGVGSSPSTTGVSQPQDFLGTAAGDFTPTASTSAVMANWGLVAIACRYNWGGGDVRHKPDGFPMGSPVDASSATGALVGTPYSIHHAVGDKGFPLALADRLDATLTTQGVPHEYHKDYAFAGVPDGMSVHRRIAYEPTMYERVRAWYIAHGVFAP